MGKDHPLILIMSRRLGITTALDTGSEVTILQTEHTAAIPSAAHTGLQNSWPPPAELCLHHTVTHCFTWLRITPCTP